MGFVMPVLPQGVHGYTKSVSHLARSVKPFTNRQVESVS
jgi:hypothetical protein